MSIGFLSALAAATAVAVANHELTQRNDIDANLGDVANLKTSVEAIQTSCKYSIHKCHIKLLKWHYTNYSIILAIEVKTPLINFSVQLGNNISKCSIFNYNRRECFDRFGHIVGIYLCPIGHNCG